MPYTTQTWSDNNSLYPVSAARMNHIESGLLAVTSSSDIIGSTVVNVKTYGAMGDGSTNDTSAILAAIASLPTTGNNRGGTLVFPPGRYMINADSLDISNLKSVAFQGAGGIISDGAYPASHLYVQNAGSWGLKISSSYGFSLRDMGVFYASAFTGDLIKTGWSGASLDPQLTLFHNFRFGDGVTKTAATLVNLDKSANVTFSGEWSISGGQRLVKGKAGTAAGDYSTQVRFFGGRFGGSQFAPILNPGEGWSFFGTTFQQLAGSSGVNDPVTGVPTVANQAGGFLCETNVNPQGLSLFNVSFYDSTAGISGSRWIDFTRASAGSTGISIVGGRIGSADIAFDFGSQITGIFITGQSWQGTFTTKVNATAGNTGVIHGTNSASDQFALLGILQMRATINGYIAWRQQSALNNVIMAASTGGANDSYRMRADGTMEYGDGTASRDTQTQRISANLWGVSLADLSVSSAGRGLRVKEGSNCKQGVTGAMVGGTLLVSNTSVTANSRIQLTRQAGGTNPGAVYESARVAGTSFTVTSTNAADTGTVAFQIFEPG